MPHALSHAQQSCTCRVPSLRQPCCTASLPWSPVCCARSTAGVTPRGAGPARPLKSPGVASPVSGSRGQPAASGPCHLWSPATHTAQKGQPRSLQFTTPNPRPTPPRLLRAPSFPPRPRRVAVETRGPPPAPPAWAVRGVRLRRASERAGGGGGAAAGPACRGAPSAEGGSAMAESWAGFSQEELRRLRGQRPGTDGDRALAGAGARDRDGRSARPGWRGAAGPGAARRGAERRSLRALGTPSPPAAAPPSVPSAALSARPSLASAYLSTAASAHPPQPSTSFSSVLPSPIASYPLSSHIHPPHRSVLGLLIQPLRSLHPHLYPSPQLIQPIPTSNTSGSPGSPSFPPASLLAPPIQAPSLTASLSLPSSPAVSPPATSLSHFQTLQPIVLHHICLSATPLMLPAFSLPACHLVLPHSSLYKSPVHPSDCLGPFFNPTSVSVISPRVASGPP